MVKPKSIPCYVPNGGAHNIINVPMGIFVRVRLKNLVRRLLDSLTTFETMFVLKPETKDVELLKALDAILGLDLKPKATRPAARALLAANEKNLKPSASEYGNDDSVNLVKFAISCGLIALLFVIAAHIQFLESIN